MEAFDLQEKIENVVIDLTAAHFWDITAVASLDKVVNKLRKQGSQVELLGLNAASATLVDRFGEQDNPKQLARILAKN